MIRVVIKENSEQFRDRWIPAGMIIFPSSGGVLTEQSESYGTKFNTKEEADRYFIQESRKKYRINEQLL